MREKSLWVNIVKFRYVFVLVESSEEYMSKKWSLWWRDLYSLWWDREGLLFRENIKMSIGNGSILKF